MATVEELRESLVSNILGHIRWGGIDAIITPDPKVPVVRDVDSLISAVDADAFARGKAEGAGQERERIRGESQMVGVDEDCIKFVGSVDNYVGAAFLVPVDVMDPPVLAPTKESI